MKIIYYVNQFFGQIGGEDQAGVAPQFTEKAVGPAMGFEGLLKGEAQIAGTIICGDNYFNENKDEALEAILKMVKDSGADLLVAGPAFNAGRYGMACAELCKAVQEELALPCITGMYEENPGLSECRSEVIVAKTGNSAADMRKALPVMANLARKLLKKENPALPEVDGYFAQGRRLTVFSDKRGSQRAVEMLLKRLGNEDFVTELPMPVFDQVAPATAIADLSKATIALVTSGGIVPHGNPDHIQSASAQKWGKYDVSGIDALKEDYFTVHGGYDPVYANEQADRVAPLDILNELKREGVIGDVYTYFYTTTGTGTSVANSVTFGSEIGKELKEAGVDGVLLTST